MDGKNEGQRPVGLMRGDSPLAALLVLDDPTPRGAALNMALDQALLECSASAVLRVYRWERPCVSIGYFEPIASARSRFPNREMVRRWTGGGTVSHGEDWTYSLIVPHADPFCRIRASDCYAIIHRALTEALQTREEGFALSLADAPVISRHCFENAVRHDVLWRGQKAAGAAQRRSRFGLLHQGSVQLPRALHPQSERLAERLAGRVELGSLAEDVLEKGRSLAASRYENPGWLNLR
ncbi:MAG: hypothetical protein RLZZ142_322 [Verrucomicrobiota bacterium]